MSSIHFFRTGCLVAKKENKGGRGQYMTLNEQLKKLIEENTTQAEVAKKMGIHRQTLNDSLRRDMRLTKFEKIVDALGYKVVFVKK